METMDTASSSPSSVSYVASDASDASAISSRLMPWLDVLNGAHVEFAPLPEDDEATDCRVVAAVRVDIKSLLANTSDVSDVMNRVRQTMELLCMAFLADAVALAQLERDGWIEIDGDTPPHDELHFPSRDLRFVLCYTALPRHCASIHQAIVAHLLTARPLCGGEVFQAAYEALHEDCKCRHQIERRANAMQVELNVTIEGSSSHLWSTAYSPIHVSGIRLRIQDIVLTRRVVFAVQETILVNVDVIQCEECAEDPRRIACSEDELRDYLSALTVIPNSGRPVLDDLDKDFTLLIRKLLHAVGSCYSIHVINIAPLAKLLSSVRNRACFWTSVLELVLCSANSSSLTLLELKGHGGLTEQDVRHLRRARISTPKVQREVHGLSIDLTGIINADDILELIRWVGHVSSLSVRQRTGLIDSRMLAGIWSACPGVERIVVENIFVFDMAIFSEAFTHTSSLKSLVIKNIVLLNTPSADKFLCEIGDTSSAIGRQLQTLQIERGNIDPRHEQPLLRVFELSTHQVRLLANALEYNSTLRRVKVAIQRDVSLEDRQRVLHQGGVNMVKHGTRKRHHQRVLSFLSVIAAADPNDPWGAWTPGRFAASLPSVARSTDAL